MYFKHTGRGDACRFPLSSTLLAMNCLKQSSWLRSVFKAFPFGPQFACALGAPAHTHMLTPTNAHRFNQPTQQKLRKERRAKKGERATWTVSPKPCGEPRAAAAATIKNRTSVFIHPVCLRAKEKASTASISMIHPELFRS